MFIEKPGIRYVKSIASVLSDKIGEKVTVAISNFSKDSRNGVDHKKIGGSDISISFNTKRQGCTLKFSISEMSPCGLAEVNHLYIYSDKKDREYYIEAMNIIIDIFATTEGQKDPESVHAHLYADRYGMGKTLLFAGNDIENALYEELGFVKIAPYYNTRYDANTRHLYLFESRALKTELIRKNGSYPKYAITEFPARRDSRRKVDFYNAVVEKNKPAAKKTVKKAAKLPWGRVENPYVEPF